MFINAYLDINCWETDQKSFIHGSQQLDMVKFHNFSRSFPEPNYGIKSLPCSVYHVLLRYIYITCTIVLHDKLNQSIPINSFNENK